MKYCANCGKAIKEETKYCGNCGEKVSSQEEVIIDRFNSHFWNGEKTGNIVGGILDIFTNTKFSNSIEEKLGSSTGVGEVIITNKKILFFPDNMENNNVETQFYEMEIFWAQINLIEKKGNSIWLHFTYKTKNGNSYDKINIYPVTPYLIDGKSILDHTKLESAYTLLLEAWVKGK